MNETHEQRAGAAQEQWAMEVRGETIRLRRACRKLHSSGQIIGFLTVTNMSLALAPWMLVMCSLLSKEVARTASGGSVLAAVLSLLLIVHYERARERGQASILGIEEKLHRSERKEPPYELDQPTEDEARRQMRAYTAVCDLPLVHGRRGPGVYALFNVIMPLLAFLILRASAG